MYGRRNAGIVVAWSCHVCRIVYDQMHKMLGNPNKNLEEYRLVSEYLTVYGFKEVEFAFREAIKYNSRKLVYVETICKKT